MPLNNLLSMSSTLSTVATDVEQQYKTEESLVVSGDLSIVTSTFIFRNLILEVNPETNTPLHPTSFRTNETVKSVLHQYSAAFLTYNIVTDIVTLTMDSVKKKVSLRIR